MRLGLLIVAGWLLLNSVWAEGQNLGPYQVIIDKAPFGAVAASGPGVTPSAMSRYGFVGLVQSGNGQLQAIIQDKQTKQCYFKAEGEMLEDVKVQKIEEALPGRRLVLRRGVETGTLNYEQPRAAVPATPGVPSSGPVIGLSVPTPTGTTLSTNMPRRIPFRR
jgi:hypothetical protein